MMTSTQKNMQTNSNQYPDQSPDASDDQPKVANPSGEEFNDDQLSERDRDAMKNTDRPAGDWSVVPDRSPSYEVPTIGNSVVGETNMTPPTEDRSAVKAPDDTFPGSGPLY